jgi:hypothetical protein
MPPFLDYIIYDSNTLAMKKLLNDTIQLLKTDVKHLLHTYAIAR